MKNIVLPLVGVAIFVVLVGLLTQRLQNKASLRSHKESAEISVGKTTLDVEIADTPEKRQKGLGGRVTLGENRGMLFVFGDEGGYAKKGVFPSFWMKDMLFSLDIIWIADGKVVKIDKNLPLPTREANELSTLPLYNPPQPIDYVLEVNSGFSDKNGVKVGTPVDLSGIGG